ncbi:enolase C-terminal domain-like protein [Rhodospirillaceae bacterium SYSU D60014]|uniref:enolase C-terminal domain-like protein n=1 Tax=Virgifigura deserti TaxID=2268457 RepID=UPI000E671DA5
MIDRLRVSAFVVPTDFPEADGTLEWNETTIVVVRVDGDGQQGLGYSYADQAVARLIEGRLADLVIGMDPMAVPRAWDAMVRSVRNLGRAGLCAAGIAAVDCALWDLKARLLDLPLATLLGSVRDAVPVYGSGGFTSYPLDRLTDQLGGWVERGIPRVKMKVGQEPDQDVERVRVARQAIGDAASLFVDANGAYDRKQALAQAEAFAEYGVSWFEEPVSSDDLDGLRLLRDRAPAGMDIAAGEYGYELGYFLRILAAGGVDVLQADATRCCGITGFLRTGVLTQAFGLPLSAHTAPSLHLHPCCVLPTVRHIEYFYDHARIEGMFFDGAPIPEAGVLRLDLSRPGLGLELREAEAARYAA